MVWAAAHSCRWAIDQSRVRRGNVVLMAVGSSKRGGWRPPCGVFPLLAICYLALGNTPGPRQASTASTLTNSAPASTYVVMRNSPDPAT